jgi:hypothetical protein
VVAVRGFPTDLKTEAVRATVVAVNERAIERCIVDVEVTVVAVRGLPTLLTSELVNTTLSAVSASGVLAPPAGGFSAGSTGDTKIGAWKARRTGI